MANKPSIPKGTRDFSPRETACRNYIFDTIKGLFTLYGYSQIETPAMENLSTLLGKYGDEGDKLLFRIVNSGDPFSAFTEQELLERSALVGKVCDKGLRYDLTVPFARFVVQHRNEISFPFKRFQIQPVWRADKPQKGRYREFYQCDIDIIGSDSLLNEAELIKVVDTVFRRLEIAVLIKVNNRKILSGIAEVIGYHDRLTDITVAIDKIDKIGIEAVIAELCSKGISEEAICKLKPVLLLQGSNEHKISSMRDLLSTSEIGRSGLEELSRMLDLARAFSIGSEIDIDLSLARGLNYYTGAIFEVKAKDVSIGSICGGGRYDDLTGIFGMSSVSGVGISFGADRIYDVLLSLNKFPEKILKGTTALFANMGESAIEYQLSVLNDLRESGISAEIYPDSTKLKKQFDYAASNSIPYLVIIGDEECNSKSVSVKNLYTGEQTLIDRGSIVQFFKKNLE